MTRTLADPPPDFCTEELCPPVIGNVLVYMDDNHITATFMTTMAPIVEQAVHAALGWQFEEQNCPDTKSRAWPPYGSSPPTLHARG